MLLEEIWMRATLVAIQLFGDRDPGLKYSYYTGGIEVSRCQLHRPARARTAASLRHSCVGFLLDY